MALPSKLLFAATALPYLRFLRDTRDPVRAQARVWEETWYEIRSSRFWRERLRASPRAAPPLALFEITDYETYREALERSFASGVSELSGRPVVFWAESGGTTGKPKLLPITEHYRRQFQSTTPPLLHSLARRFPGLLAAPVLYFVEAARAERSPTGLEVGYISNFNYRKIPGPLQRFYAFPREVLRDAATLAEWGPLYALATDLSAMFAITPASLTQLAARVRAERDRLWPYLESRADPPPPLPPVRVARERLLRVERALARDPLSFKELWPALEVICCWKAAACGLQLRALEPHLEGRVPVTDATYSATEGWMNVPLETDAVGGPVHPGAHVLEFLPAGTEPRKELLIPLAELRPGEEYEVFLTTSMGLIRYRLRDIVRCTGRFGTTPCIAFSQKAGSEVSLGLTRVSEAQIVRALASARVEPRGRMFVAPAATGDGLVLCLERAEDLASAERLAQVEEELRAQNKYYAADVGDGLLRPLAQQVLAADAAAWRSEERAQEKPRLLRQSPFVGRP